MINEKNYIDSNGGNVENRWSRLTVVLINRPLVASCHLGEIYSSPNIKVCIANQCFSGISERYTFGNDADNGQLFRALVHIDTRNHNRVQTRAAFFTVEPPHPKVVALQVSTQYVQEGHEVIDDEWIWLSMGTARHAYLADGWIEQFMRLDWSSAKRIAETPLDQRASLYDLENDFGKLLDITHPGKPENLLAYRLLREASVACGDKEQVENFNNTGLTIHGPKSLQDWWKPFDEDEAKALGVLARCIVDNGDPGDSENWNKVKTHLSGSDAKALKSAVAAFLKVRDTETAQR